MEAYRAALKQYAPKEQPSSNSAASYAGAMAFAEVLKSIKGDITSQSISEALAAKKTVDTGMLPPLNWSKDAHLGTNQLQRVEVQDGKFVAQGEFVDAPPLAG